MSRYRDKEEEGALCTPSLHGVDGRPVYKGPTKSNTSNKPASKQVGPSSLQRESYIQRAFLNKELILLRVKPLHDLICTMVP